MRCEFDADLDTFAAVALPWLERDPVLNNVAHSLISGRHSGEQPVEPGAVWIRILDDDGSLAGVALRTPPHPLLVPELSEPAARALAAGYPDAHLAGVNGTATPARAFVAGWRARTGAGAELAMSSRLYRLDEVRHPADVPGRLRAATPDDAAVAAAWFAAFTREAGGEPVDIAAAVEQRIRNGRLFFWDVDGGPVSMAGDSPTAAGVVRVSLVYTPRERRRNGYAGALVAALSQRLLDSGATACMLYTDLANPTSNKVYQQVGYYPVAEAESWRFTTA